MTVLRIRKNRCLFLRVTDKITLPQDYWSFLSYIERQGFILLFYLRPSCVAVDMISFVSLFHVYPYNQPSLPWVIWLCASYFWHIFSVLLTDLSDIFSALLTDLFREKNKNCKLYSKVSQIASNDNLISGCWLYSYCTILPFILGRISFNENQFLLINE